MDRGFHYKDGLFFKRIDEEGSVQITKMKSAHHAETVVIFQVVINPTGWASIISDLSKRGETSDNFYKALEFHMGK